MQKRSLISVAMILYVWLFAAFAAPPPSAPTTDEVEAWVPLFPGAIKRVKNGEIVVENAPPETDEKSHALIAAFIVDVNIEEAYRIIRETEKQIEYTKVLLDSRLIERTDTYEIVEFKVKFMAWNLTYRTRHEWDDDKYQTWWALDPTFDNSLALFEGYFHFFYIDDNHTLVRYRAEMIIRDYFPHSIQQLIVRHDMPNGLEDVRRRINSHGTYRLER